MKRLRSLQRLFVGCCLLIAPFTTLSSEESANSSSLDTPDELFIEGIVVDLRDPVLKNGILSTSKGGIISAPGLRIQAKNITYTRKVEAGESIFKVEAEGQLMLEYGERVFIGESVSYDFNTRTGTIYNGTTGIEPWYIGAADIRLHPNGNYTMDNGYITTCGNTESEWQISARNVLVPKDDQIAASNIQVRFLSLPLFWLPSFTGNVKKILRAPIQTRVHWGGARGSRLTMKYRFLSTENWNAFMRLDYRLKRGIGGGVETNYESDNKKAKFQTRNYVANDNSITDERKRHRFRFEGKYSNRFHQDKTTLDIKYDKLSDSDMPSDFDESDFNLETASRTEFLLRRLDKAWILSLIGRAQINSFQSLKQELPTLDWRIKPFVLGDTGILSDNDFKASYLNFAHSDAVGKHFDFESSRLQAQSFLYRPFHIQALTFTPKVGVLATHYDRSPLNRESNTIISYLGAEANANIYKIYGNSRHNIEPYVRYHYYKMHEDQPDDHYIFDYDDSVSSLNMMRAGFKNTLFDKGEKGVRPALTVDLYANGFFNTDTIIKTVPKIYTDVTLTKLENFLLNFSTSWDTRLDLIDHYNVMGQWTQSENLAVSAEYRERKASDLRKADRSSFFLESLRNQETLESSVLADERKTVLGNLYYRFTPNWVAHLQSRHGFERPGTPSYNEFQIDLLTMIRCSWRAKISYQYTESDSRLSFNIRLDEGRSKREDSKPYIWP